MRIRTRIILSISLIAIVITLSLVAVWLQDKSQQELQRISELEASMIMLEANPLDTSMLTLPYDGGTLYLNKTIVGSSILLTTQRGKPNPELIHSQDFNLYVFTSPSQDIHLLNPTTLQITQVSSDQTNEFSKEKMLRMAHPGGSLIWAYDPLISGDNQLVSFHTNRRSIQEGDNQDDIWTIDLESGIEQLSVKNGRSLFWSDRRIFYYDSETSSIGTFNYDTHEVIEHITSIESYRALNNQIIVTSRPNDQTLSFYDITNGQTVHMPIEATSRATFNFRLSPDGKKVLGTMFLDRTDADSRTFFVLDLHSQEVTFIAIPVERKGLVEILGWLNNEEFVANVYSGDQRKSDPIVISIVDRK